ncbi:MAG: Na(+)-translocating NADH-quinone reductase subunit A [Pseudomonadota bacterium]
MKIVNTKKGLNLPITGTPDQSVSMGAQIKSVAALGSDYIGLKPKMLVQEGDDVKLGEPLFCHKVNPEAVIVSPATGKVQAINRGARRVLESVVVSVSDSDDDGIDFSTIGGADTPEKITVKLCAAGLWTSFRTRPYSKVPDVADKPVAIFVSAMDSEPLAADANLIINERLSDFQAGLEVVARLTEGSCFVCQSPDAGWSIEPKGNISQVGFNGPHPAGLAGTHIHFLAPPVSEGSVWTIAYPDVIRIGALFQTGRLDTETIISVAGPAAKNPRLVRTRMGASLHELLDGEMDTQRSVRVLSGSVLSGRAAEGSTAFLGRYHRQVSLIEEDKKQIPMGWIRPMAGKFAFQPVLGSAFSKKLYDLTSNLNGGRRAMVPIGTFEMLMPQDFLPTQLLRAMLVKDTDSAQAMGILELDEEDLGLVGFACPAKYEYGQALRECLDKIEIEG